MNPIKKIFSAMLIGAFMFATLAPSVRGDDKPRPTQGTPGDDLGYDVYNGKTNKIGRVFKATPTSVYVIYEDGLGGRDIPRNDLPAPLKTRYPYDPQAASSYIKSQAAEGMAKSQARRQALELQEAQVLIRINKLEKKKDDTEAKIKNLSRELKVTPKSKTLKAEKLQLLKEQGDTGEQLAKLKSVLKQTQDQIAVTP